MEAVEWRRKKRVYNGVQVQYNGSFESATAGWWYVRWEEQSICEDTVSKPSKEICNSSHRSTGSNDSTNAESFQKG